MAHTFDVVVTCLQANDFLDDKGWRGREGMVETNIECAKEHLIYSEGKPSKEKDAPWHHSLCCGLEKFMSQ
jgi:hypothetical protein